MALNTSMLTTASSVFNGNLSSVTSSSEAAAPGVNVEADPDLNFKAKMETVVSIVVPIFFSLVVLIGFFGNNLVILVVCFNRQMRNTTNLLILNLAVADLCFVVCCVPFTATTYALPHNWPFGDVM